MFGSVLFFSRPRSEGWPHQERILSPFVSVLCHSDRLLQGESRPRLDVIHPGRAWYSSVACISSAIVPCILFLQATPLFPHVVTIWYALTVSNSSLFTPALLRTHSIRYDTRCYFNVRSKANMSRLKLPHSFVTARCYASAVLAMGLCLSVRPSQVGVLLKRLNVGSHKHHTIAQGL